MLHLWQVPRTHRLPTTAHSPTVLLERAFRSDDDDDDVTAPLELPLKAMPNHVEMAVKAGTACCFDNAIWHTSMQHAATAPERRNVIYSYTAWTMRSGMGSVVERLQSEGKLDSERRRSLFGL